MSELRTTRIEPSFCPSCGATLDAATGEGAPSPGAISVCADCGAVTIFSADLTHRLPTDAELIEILADEAVSRQIAEYQAICKRRRSRFALN
jgi:hypothetical protein